MNALTAIIRRLLAALDTRDGSQIAAITITIVYANGEGHKPWVIEYLDAAQLRCLLIGDVKKEQSR
jgi:hypothetical protein